MVIDNLPCLMIEVKWGSDSPSKNFSYFSKYIDHNIEKIQLVKELKREKSMESGIDILSVVKWLVNLNLSVFCKSGGES